MFKLPEASDEDGRRGGQPLGVSQMLVYRVFSGLLFFLYI